MTQMTLCSFLLKTPKKGNCFAQYSDRDETPQALLMKRGKQKNKCFISVFWCFIGVFRPELFRTKQLIVSRETTFHGVCWALTDWLTVSVAVHQG